MRMPGHVLEFECTECGTRGEFADSPFVNVTLAPRRQCLILNKLIEKQSIPVTVFDLWRD